MMLRTVFSRKSNSILPCLPCLLAVCVLTAGVLQAESADVGPDDRLKVGHENAAKKDYTKAREEYAAVLDNAKAPIHYKALALFCIADTYLYEKNYDEASEVLSKAMGLGLIPPHFAWEVTERKREIARLKAGEPARDPQRSRTQPPEHNSSVSIYVATDGKDSNSGTKKEPFATLLAARDAVRALKKKGALPEGGVAVILRAGDYEINRTFSLGSRDSGSDESPIIYRSYEREEVRLTAGMRIGGFKRVQDKSILARLPQDARGKILQLDLKTKGITGFGSLQPHGFGFDAQPVTELFFDGKPMQLARWPNEGFVKVADVVKKESVFKYEGDRPARWKQARDVWMYGYWYHLWADSAVGVASIDTKTSQVKTTVAPNYGIRKGQPYYYYNLLEEIDMPGEWYLDRSSEILYLYPPSDPEKAVITLSMLNDPMIELDGASHVSFQNLVLEYGRSSGIVIRGGHECRVVACTIRCFGGDAVQVTDGENHGVLACDLYTLGRGGVRMHGGDRKTLTPGGHFVENCHVYDFSRVDRTYTPAVWMDGCGNRIAHNLFHDSPCHAMRIEGNDHLIEFNEVHTVNRESDDQGGLDMWFDHSYRGNTIRYNFWHSMEGSGHLLHGKAGVRLDDAISGTVVYGNVFYKSSHGNFGGVQIHGGKDNWIDNNVFVNCKHGVSFSTWGEKRWKSTLARPDAVKKMTEQVNIYKPPYSTQYPSLARIKEGADINNIWRNVLHECGSFMTRDRGVQNLMDNAVLDADPGFVDAAHMDFELKRNAPLSQRPGFRPIPFKEIGLYYDSLRRYEPMASYSVRYVEGWKIIVNNALLGDGRLADIGETCLNKFQKNLATIKTLIHPDPLKELMKVPIWLEVNTTRGRHGPTPGFHYHPGLDWLVDMDYNPAKHKCVEFGVAKGYANRDPKASINVVLHELAHGYHDRVLSFENEDVKAAYKRVVEGTSFRARDWVRSNHKEFFCGVTQRHLLDKETRVDQEKRDPKLAALLTRIWEEAGTH